MIRKFTTIVPLLMLCLLSRVFAQAEHPVTKAFGTALSQGDISSLSAMMDDEVELLQPGETGKFRKQAATGKLAAFLRQNPPASFMVKHQGSSADGQVYAIGQYTSQTGGNYKVLLRAKPLGNQYRIFKLDLIQNL